MVDRANQLVFRQAWHYLKLIGKWEHDTWEHVGICGNRFNGLNDRE